MHISLKFKNLDPRFRTDWRSLRKLITMVKLIYPKQKVEVAVEYEFCSNFEVNPTEESVYVKGDITISVTPTTNVQKDAINPQYESLRKSIVDQIIQFLANSDPHNDSSVQPSYFPSTVIHISAGFGVSKFKNGEPDPYL